MADRQKPESSEHDLATHATVGAADALGNRVALISGGGIGRAVGWLLPRLGAHVVITGRDPAALDPLVSHPVRKARDAPGPKSRRVIVPLPLP